jgi:plasmid stability protein
MKNITVSVDEETYREARIKAAKEGTSVSALVRDYLNAIAHEEGGQSEFDRLAQLQERTLKRIRSRKVSLSAADNLSREVIHDRDAIR